MYKLLQEKWLIIIFAIIIFVTALLFENSFPDTYMIPLSRYPGSLRIPFSVFILLILIFLALLTIVNYKKTKKYLLNKGFLEAPAEILSIEEKGSFGSPHAHSLDLVLHIVVKPVGTASFKTAIQTSIRENGNAALPPVRRIPDYKVGDIVTVIYHPESHETVIPNSLI